MKTAYTKTAYGRTSYMMKTVDKIKHENTILKVSYLLQV